MITSQKTQYYTINDPVELLEYINSQLKPKLKQKQENGEVFTPLPLVKEMLDKLDEAYKQEHGESIFTNKSLTWFDPAVGIGNFPIIVYQRLMIGLSSAIPDEEERRRHILEDMLYMSEITPKNVFICSKIFCGDKYKKLKLYQGDTLKMDPKKEWGIDKFDIVIGNPPYNKGGIRSHTGNQLADNNETIWPKFIDKSF